jgi:hypothetical protein
MKHPSLKARLQELACQARARGDEAQAQDLEAACLAVGLMSGQEMERLRSIEHHAWRLLDENGDTENLGELPEASSPDLEALTRLLPGTHVQPNLLPLSFQARVKTWLMECFGEEISSDIQERGDRFLEEVLELLQANGYDPTRIDDLRNYVWNRPAGERKQEAGGVMVTLAAYCLATKVDMHMAGEEELARIWVKIEQIRAKQASKNGSTSPLPTPFQFEQPLTPDDAIEGCKCEYYLPLSMANMRMIVCSICGNKRCPHATHHLNACTNSNEPGQKGSSWEHYPMPVKS